MRQVLLILVLLLPLTIYSQSQYKPLQCIGEIPEDFRKSTREKFFDDLNNEEKANNTKDIYKTKRNFYLQSNFLLNDLLLSGNVLFGDSLTNYVCNVADILLEGNKDLRSKLRFYVVKSSDVNAFSTDQGMIFITLGLLSKIESEAQLAFVLSHEIIHFMNRHVINTFINEKEIARSGRYMTSSDKLKLISSYSRENEIEADSIGYIIFSKSRYNQIEAIKTLDVIQYSHLPFAEINFSNEIFENNIFKFNDSYKLNSLNEINRSNDNENDLLSSHPNIRTRKSRLENQSRFTSDNGNSFILGSKLFFNIQKLARKEVIYQYSIKQDYMFGYYNSFALSQLYPNDLFFQEMQLKFLYGLSKYKNLKKFSKVSTSYKLIEGEGQQAYYFFDKLLPEELNSLAAVKLYNFCIQYPDKIFMSKLRDDLFFDLIYNHNLTCNNFTDAFTNYKNNLDSTLIIYQKDSNEINENIKDSSLKKDNLNSSNYLLAFSELILDKNFLRYFDSIQVTVSNEEIDKEKINERVKNLTPNQKKKHNSNIKNGNLVENKIELDKMVIVDPYYFEADSRKGLEILNSEKGTITFNENVAACFNAAKIDATILSTKDLISSDVNNFNDISLLNSFYEEWLMHENENIISLQSEYTGSLIKKYNTNYFNYTGLITIKAKRPHKYLYIIGGIFSGPLWPVLITIGFTPIRATQYDSVIFDLNSLKPINTYHVQIKARSNFSFINSQIYYQLIKLKK